MAVNITNIWNHHLDFETESYFLLAPEPKKQAMLFSYHFKLSAVLHFNFPGAKSGAVPSDKGGIGKVKGWPDSRDKDIPQLDCIHLKIYMYINMNRDCGLW